MFSFDFLSFKPVCVTEQMVEWNREKLEKLYEGEKPAYFKNDISDRSSDFQLSKQQSLMLLDFIIAHTKEQYALFNAYRKQIDKLQETSPKPDLEAGLHWAKKTLEEHLWFICNKPARVELLNGYMK